DDPGLDETLGRDAIDVLVVDDRDLAALDALGEILRAHTDARDADHRHALVGRRGVPPAAPFTHQARAFARCSAATASSSPAPGRCDPRTPARIPGRWFARGSSNKHPAPAGGRPPRSCFWTESCESAKAATWARCVTHKT